MEQGIVLGIDGGGTYTRVVAADLTGNMLAYSKKQGSHPGKNKFPEKNVKEAIMEVLQLANYPASSVRCIVGGFSGLNGLEDQQWAKKFLLIPGIQCPMLLLNDANIAQFGAFLGKHGVLAIAGTGSIVFGKTENGLSIKNYDFHHDSEAGSRYLSLSVIYEIISKELSSEDYRLIQLLQDYWEVKDIEELRICASKGFSADKIEAVQKLSRMGAIVTSEAANGNQTAIRACKKAIDSLVTGVQIVASTFSSDVVPLALVGGVVTTPFFEKMFKEELNTINSIIKYSYQPIQLSPVMGGVLYAYSELGILINDALLENLSKADKKHRLYD